MRIIAIIPARGGSKGIPHKNIVSFFGFPLIYWSIKAAQESSYIDDIIVSSDDPSILDVSNQHGCTSILRPPEISADTSSSYDCIKHVLTQLNLLSDNSTIIVLLQPTSPLRTSHHIDSAISFFLGSSTYDSLVSVVSTPHNHSPESIMTIDQTSNCLVNYSSSARPSRRQDKPSYYSRNGAAIYITTPQVLTTSILGDKVAPFIMSKADSIDIDDYDDLLIAELLMSHRAESGKDV